MRLRLLALFSLVAATPTFISYVLDRASGDQLATLETVVVGAEKCPQSVFDRCQKVDTKTLILLD
jgi:long-chain-fatty-acid--[acyl-carrier-protein] ligase